MGKNENSLGTAHNGLSRRKQGFDSPWGHHEAYKAVQEESIPDRPFFIFFAGTHLMTEINLRKMVKNQSGTIKSVKVGGELGRRIREMGLVPGTEITIQGRAPLYDPVALRVMGGTLTLRNNEADYIVIEIADEG